MKSKTGRIFYIGKGNIPRLLWMIDVETLIVSPAKRFDASLLTNSKNNY